jgi:hypothetical protein
VQPKASPLALPHVGSGFSSAGAVRTPHTLDGPTVAPAQASAAPASSKKALNAKKKTHAASKTVMPAQQ